MKNLNIIFDTKIIVAFNVSLSTWSSSTSPLYQTSFFEFPTHSIWLCHKSRLGLFTEFAPLSRLSLNLVIKHFSSVPNFVFEFPTHSI